MAASESSLPVTLIETWTARPGSQNELAAAVLEIYETIRHKRGFIRVRLHKSVDGNRVAAYAEWQNRDVLEELQGDPAWQSAQQRIAPHVESDDHNLYLASATLEA